jgi:hypothetical protein
VFLELATQAPLLFELPKIEVGAAGDYEVTNKLVGRHENENLECIHNPDNMSFYSHLTTRFGTARVRAPTERV